MTPPEVEPRLLHETVEDAPCDEPQNLVVLTGSGIVGARRSADEFRVAPIVIGGIAATLSNPEWHLEHADALVQGEAGEVWPRLLGGWFYEGAAPVDLAAPSAS